MCVKGVSEGKKSRKRDMGRVMWSDSEKGGFQSEL